MLQTTSHIDVKKCDKGKKNGYIFRILPSTTKYQPKHFIPVENNLSCIFPLAIARFFLFACMLSHSVMSDFATPWTAACQVLLYVGILQARILEWVASPPPGDLPNPGIELRSPSFQADSLPSEPPGKAFFFFSFITQFILRWCLVEYINICHHFRLIYKCVTNY